MTEEQKERNRQKCRERYRRVRGVKGCASCGIEITRGKFCTPCSIERARKSDRLAKKKSAEKKKEMRRFCSCGEEITGTPNQKKYCFKCSQKRIKKRERARKRVCKFCGGKTYHKKDCVKYRKPSITKIPPLMKWWDRGAFFYEITSRVR